jgi:hypothetical protein
MARKLQHIFFVLLLLFVLPAFCQMPQASQATEARVETLVKQLTLEEKIDLLSGVDDFFIRDIQHIGRPD